MADQFTTSRRRALKLTGGAMASGAVSLAAMPTAAEESEPADYREFLPTAEALGDSAGLEFAHLDLDGIRTNREQRREDTIFSALDDEETDLSDLSTLLRLPLSITLSLTVSGFGALLFGNIISLGWDSEEERPDLRSSSLLWVNGVTIVRGSFTASEAIDAVRGWESDYEAIGSHDEFELYQRQSDGIFGLFDRSGHTFAADDGVLAISRREDGLDRVQTVLDTVAGRIDRQHEQDEEFAWATEQSDDDLITAGCVDSESAGDVTLSEEISDLSDASTIVGGIDVDGWETNGSLRAVFDRLAPDKESVASAVDRDRSSLSLERDGRRLAVVDSE